MRLAASSFHASGTDDRFTIHTVPGRLARLRSDPWTGYTATRQTMPRDAVRALEQM